MAAYFVNMRPQANGDHEVHRSDCAWMPAPLNRDFLGDYRECAPAIAEAKRRYPRVNGCAHCAPECHTS